MEYEDYDMALPPSTNLSDEDMVKKDTYPMREMTAALSWLRIASIMIAVERVDN